MIKHAIHNEQKQFNFIYESETDPIYKHHKQTGSFYEIDLLKKLQELKPKGSFIDVGPNIGNHVVFYANFLECSKLYCFQPDDRQRNFLIENIEKNCWIEETVVLPYSLSDKETKIQIGMFNDKNEIEKNNDFDKKTIDYFSFQNVGLINFQDKETKVLKGAIETIRMNKPIVVAELKTRSKLTEFYKHISKFGYKTDLRNYGNSSTYIFTI